jgi:hypothetical protein
VSAAAARGSELSVFVTFVEIYGNHVFDLLSKKREQVTLKDDASGVCHIDGAAKRQVQTAEKLLEMIEVRCGSRTLTRGALSPPGPLTAFASRA